MKRKKFHLNLNRTFVIFFCLLFVGIYITLNTINISPKKYRTRAENSQLPLPIISGKPVKQGAWPFMVALYDRSESTTRIDLFDWFGERWFKQKNIFKRFICGGTVIDREWILTAGHCVVTTDKKMKEIGIVAGFTDFNNKDQAIVMDIDEQDIILNEKYMPLMNIGLMDIAVIKLKTPLPDTIPSISLNDSDELIREKTLATILGWGNYEPDKSEKSSFLRDAIVPVMSLERATKRTAKRLNYQDVLPNANIFLGFPKGGVNTCFGDSGGPAVTWDKNTQKWIQIGITSWSRDCREVDYPAADSNIKYFSKWIYEKTHIGPYEGTFSGKAPDPGKIFEIEKRVNSEFMEDDQK